jgi:hypothetical protein
MFYFPEPIRDACRHRRTDWHRVVDLESPVSSGKNAPVCRSPTILKIQSSPLPSSEITR